MDVFILSSSSEYTIFSKLSEFAPQLHIQKQVSGWMGEEDIDKGIVKGDYFNSYRNFLLSTNVGNMISLAIGDSVFSLYQPSFQAYRGKLLYSEKPAWNRFKLGDLQDREFHQLASYYNSRKHHFDFWSAEYRSTNDIFKRYQAMLKKPELRLVIQHASSPDSTIVVTYRPISLNDKLFVGGIEARNLPVSAMVVQLASIGGALIVTMLFLFIFILILIWRAIKIEGKLGWIELMLLLFACFPVNLTAGSLYWQNMFTYIPNQLALWMVVGLIWQNPTPLSGKRIWKWLFILLALFIFINKGISAYATVIYPLILGLFLIQLLRQKGLRRKVMWRWFTLGFMPLGLFIGLIIVFILSFNYLLEPLLHLLNLSGSVFFNNGLVYSLSFDYWFFMLMMSILMVIFVSIPGGLILGMLEFPLRLYYRMRRWLSAIITFGAYLMILAGITIFGDKLLSRNFFVLFFLAIAGIILSWLAMKFFRFLDPVHHDERKALRKLLESSFGFNEEKAYFDFYRDYLTKLYPKTKVGLAIEGCELGLEQFQMLGAEQIAAIPQGVYFNLDLARLDRHPEAKAFPEWIPPKRRSRKKQQSEVNDESKLKEVRLFYPLTDSNGKHSGYLYLAESGKLYWDSENAGFIAETVSIFNSFLNNIRLNTSYREEQLHLEREKQERILNEQLALEREKRNQELQEINRRIMDSINYASLIQRSILPKEDTLKQYLRDYFIIWKPRDVVGGDYYWFYPLPGQKKSLIAVIDCTGHGVPGAFMTLMTNSILNSIVRDRGIISPDEIIRLLHQEVRYTLQQGHSESMKDGLDISLILVDWDKAELCCSGAVHKTLFFGESGLQVISGAKHSLGGIREELNPELEVIYFQPGDILYLLTDGILDQPVLEDGAVKRRIFRDWTEVFESNASLDFCEQEEAWLNYLEILLSHSEQRDDITLLGLRL
jgi:serine phosphatase RsbU (regulator of sigma subunit)